MIRHTNTILWDENNKYIYEIRKLELQEPSKWPAFMLVAKLVEQWWLGGGGRG